MRGWRDVIDTMRIPDYRLFTVGHGASLIGTWIQRLAVGWLTWELTHSGTWLGIIAFADLFPTVFVTPFAGAIADNCDRLRATRLMQALLLLQAILLWLTTATGVITIHGLLALVLAGGIVSAFDQPMRMALLPSLVDRSHLPAAIAINSILFNVARFIGPGIAGLTVVLGDVSFAFLINALTFAIFLAAILRVRVAAAPRALTERQPYLTAIADGLRYVAGHFGLTAMFATMLVAALCIRPIGELLPQYADAGFGLGVEGLAMMTSVMGAGAIIGAVWLAGYADPQRLIYLGLANGFLLGGTLIVAVTTTSVAVALLALGVLAFGMVISGITSQTMIQLAVDDRLRGRVVSLHGVIFRGGPAVGAFIMGAISDVAGLAMPMLVGAVLTILLSTLLWLQRARIASMFKF